MADTFLLVEVHGDKDRGNPRPPGTQVIQSADDLDEIREFLEVKCGANRRLIADGGNNG
jgi:hypothetical protein